MTTMPCPAAAMSLVRPWPQRLADAVVERRRAWRAPRALQESDLVALAGLSPKTLRDIGAPEWVQERARGRTDPWTQTVADRRSWRWLP